MKSLFKFSLALVLTAPSAFAQSVPAAPDCSEPGNAALPVCLGLPAAGVAITNLAPVAVPLVAGGALAVLAGGRAGPNNETDADVPSTDVADDEDDTGDDDTADTDDGGEDDGDDNVDAIVSTISTVSTVSTVSTGSTGN